MAASAGNEADDLEHPPLAAGTCFDFHQVSPALKTYRPNTRIRHVKASKIAKAIALPLRPPRSYLCLQASEYLTRTSF